MKKIVCIVLSLLAVVYSVGYASIGGFSGNDGALSKIGIDHPVLFFIWGAVTFSALSFNIIVGFSKTKYKFYIPLLAVAFIGMVLTLCFDFDYDKYSQYILHCAGSLTFSVVMGITVLLLFVCSKNFLFTLITAVVLIVDLILLIIYKETALIELIPIFFGYLLMGIYNTRKEKITVET